MIFLFARLARFIPAGAGNTDRALHQSGVVTVYPRWRGEHDNGSHAGCILYGLSPLARGTLSCNRRQRPRCRFIPAGAGNTHSPLIRNSPIAVYPRWRGEHNELVYQPPVDPGLSPLARGTPEQTKSPAMPGRFIPAGAGNTRLQS